jgi:hypothetical protein
MAQEINAQNKALTHVIISFNLSIGTPLPGLFAISIFFSKSLNNSYAIDTNGNIDNWRHQNAILCSEEYFIKSLYGHELKKYCLMTETDFEIYCDFIVSAQVGDATIKNIYIEKYGICHWHTKNDPIISLEL